MYRWFFIFAVLNFADSADLLPRALCRGDVSRYCRPSQARYYGPPHNYYHGSGPTDTETLPSNNNVQPLSPANTFEDLAQNLATAESAVRKYCSDNSIADVKDVFGVDAYILKYTLRDFKHSDINVKIKHRVIYVTANQAGLASFKDLRILPNIVNTRLASWALENNYLKIAIPYNMAFGRETVNKCGDVNESIIEVPSMKSNLVPRSKNFLQPLKRVKTTTSTAQPDIPKNNEDDTITIDDALTIISQPGDVAWDIDVRNYQL